MNSFKAVFYAAPLWDQEWIRVSLVTGSRYPKQVSIIFLISDGRLLSEVNKKKAKGTLAGD